MPLFHCKKCGRTVKAEFEQCCKPSETCLDEYPQCCGQPMVEIMDD